MKNLIVAIIILFAGCTSEKNACGSDAVKATIKDFTGLDGCGWVLVLEDDTRLEPLNLVGQTVAPADGKKVWLRYKVANNSASICMVGEMVEITCIGER